MKLRCQARKQVGKWVGFLQSQSGGKKQKQMGQKVFFTKQEAKVMRDHCLRVETNKESKNRGGKQFLTLAQLLIRTTTKLK